MVSADSGSASASSRTLCQCCSAGAGSLVPDQAAARACQRAASSVSCGGLPVLRQERRALVEAVGVVLGDRPRHSGVDRSAALAELRAVGHLLRQRVLEGVERLGIELLLVDELAPPPRLRSASSSSGRIEVDRRAPAPAPGNSLPITAAACSTDLSRGASRSIRAARTACTLAGMAASATGAASRVGAALAFEAPGLDQRLHELLDEERVALGALADQLSQSVQRGIVAEQLGEQLLDRLGAERGERDLAVVGPRHPRRVVLGPEVDDQSGFASPGPPPRDWRGRPRSPGRASAGPRSR